MSQEYRKNVRRKNFAKFSFIIVMNNNKPDVAIMDFNKWEEEQAIMDVLQSREEARRGKAKLLKGSLADLWNEAKTSNN